MKYLFTILFILFFAFNVIAQVKVFPGGNATIGATTTSVFGHKLQVSGNAIFTDTSDTASITSAALIRANRDFSQRNNPDYTWSLDNQTGIFHPYKSIIGFTIDSYEKMRISDNGSLLIGTQTGNPRLVVNAGENRTAFKTVTDDSSDYWYAHVSYVNRSLTKNWVIVYDTTENFYVYGNGDVYGHGYTDMSDSSMKENIQTLTGAKARILSLRGVSYNLKPLVLNNPADTFTVLPSSPPQNEIGLIAQEVEQIAPEVVSTTNQGIKGIQYGRLTALLIEAFKEQNQTIDSLKQQLMLCCPTAPPPGGGERHINPNNNNTEQPQGARLDPNNPNPWSIKTDIHFYLPENSVSKTLMVFDMQGTLIKQYQLTTKGESFLTISANELKAGMYLYSLVIDGKEIDTKRMILMQ